MPIKLYWPIPFNIDKLIKINFNVRLTQINKSLYTVNTNHINKIISKKCTRFYRFLLSDLSQMQKTHQIIEAIASTTVTDLPWKIIEMIDNAICMFMDINFWFIILLNQQLGSKTCSFHLQYEITDNWRIGIMFCVNLLY